MKRNRKHKRYGQSKAKLIASKDITDACERNYIFDEFKIWDYLKSFNPEIISINTNLL